MDSVTSCSTRSTSSDCLAEEAKLTGVQREVPKAWYDVPTYYRGNPSTVVGNEADVRRPSFGERLDFELEIACVIGLPGRDIAEAEALDHVFALHDLQRRVGASHASGDAGRHGPGEGQDFDTGNVLGPWWPGR